VEFKRDAGEPIREGVLKAKSVNCSLTLPAGLESIGKNNDTRVSPYVPSLRPSLSGTIIADCLILVSCQNRERASCAGVDALGISTTLFGSESTCSRAALDTENSSLNLLFSDDVRLPFAWMRP
jgi:hypothetical protein